MNVPIEVSSSPLRNSLQNCCLRSISKDLFCELESAIKEMSIMHRTCDNCWLQFQPFIFCSCTKGAKRNPIIKLKGLCEVVWRAWREGAFRCWYSHALDYGIKINQQHLHIIKVIHDFIAFGQWSEFKFNWRVLKERTNIIICKCIEKTESLSKVGFYTCWQ